MPFRIKRGDTAPPFRQRVTEINGLTVDLTGASARFIMRDPTGALALVSAPATITDASSGTVEYRWDPSDTAVAGRREAEFEITFADGRKRTHPALGYLDVYVLEALADLT